MVDPGLGNLLEPPHLGIVLTNPHAKSLAGEILIAWVEPANPNSPAWRKLVSFLVWEVCRKDLFTARRAVFLWTPIGSRF